jgi:hypothetical protein
MQHFGMAVCRIVPMLLGGKWGWTVEWCVPHEIPFARGFFVDDEAAKVEARWLLAWEAASRCPATICSMLVRNPAALPVQLPDPAQTHQCTQDEIGALGNADLGQDRHLVEGEVQIE